MGVRDAAIVYFDGVLKLLGVSHGMLGGLLVILGVVVRIVVDHWTSVMLLALWIGVIVSVCFYRYGTPHSKSSDLLTFLYISVDFPCVVCFRHNRS